MCGIVGYAGRPYAIDESLMLSMRDALMHRGPDGEGIWFSADHSVVLGHRRLAIVDLSPTGAQPMISRDGNFAITFNGEIYNHKELRVILAASGIDFVGRSDTEVLLAAYRVWGEDCVKRLRGMFAFAIYDARRKVLFLARDRAGEKPLYWARHRNGIVFASELKALMKDSEFKPQISPEGLAFYLTYGYVPGDFCILRGVHKLMPGHSLTVSLQHMEVVASRFWDLPQPDPADLAERAALVDELQSLLSSAVKEQLEADVPVAVLLSGGVDSSIVTALAASVSSGKVRTFTVSIPGDTKMDESRYARRISEYFGTDHVELPLDASSLDVLHKLAEQFDEPICDSSMIPTYLLASTVSRHCKVVLGGDGGDELFGGYKSYQGVLRQARLREFLPSLVRAGLAVGAESLMPVGADRRNGLIGLRGSLEDGLAQNGILFDSKEWNAFSPWLAAQPLNISPKQWRRGLIEPGRGVPGAAMAADLRTYLPEDILAKVDRASMLCSLEVRAPLLDHRVMDFAFARVPNALRATLGERKILLKDLARRLLPADVDLERKQGFSIPLSKWLTPAAIQQWKSECREQIDAILPNAARIWKDADLSDGMFHRIFSLRMLTHWMKQYKVSV